MTRSKFNRGLARSIIGGQVFYGWFVVASCALLLAVSMGICFSFGVFFKALCEEFSWNRATTSSIFSFYLLLGGVFSIFSGWASDRWGPRPVVLVMGALTGLSLFLTARVQSAWQMFITYSVLLSLGTSGIYSIVMSTGSRWFIKKRATALAVIGVGVGLGTIILAPVVSWLISSFHWRSAYQIIGFISLVLMIIPALLLKKEPSTVGTHPDGLQIPVHLLRPTASDDLSLKEATRTRDLWLLFYIWFAYSFCVHTVIAHVPPRAQDLGIYPFQAATIISIIGAAAVPARLISGRISDSVEGRHVAMVFALLCALAMFCLILATKLWIFYVFAVLFGSAYGGLDPPIISMVGRIFGLRNVGAIMGILMVGWSSGAAVGPYLSGLAFDNTGSYGFVFFGGGLMILLAAACIRYLCPPFNLPSVGQDG